MDYEELLRIWHRLNTKRYVIAMQPTYASSATTLALLVTTYDGNYWRIATPRDFVHLQYTYAYAS